MPNNGNDNFQIAAARNLTPRLMRRIRDFDGLKIKPCKFRGYNQDGQEIVEPCELAQVSLWAVYGHYSPDSGKRGDKVLDDFDTKGEAQKFHNILIDVFPHLAYRHHRLQPQPLPQSKLAPHYGG